MPLGHKVPSATTLHMLGHDRAELICYHDARNRSLRKAYQDCWQTISELRCEDRGTKHRQGGAMGREGRNCSERLRVSVSTWSSSIGNAWTHPSLRQMAGYIGNKAKTEESLRYHVEDLEPGGVGGLADG